MSLIGRFFVIFFALMVAIVAAGMALAFALLGPTLAAVSDDPVNWVFQWFAGFISISFVGGAVFLPALVLIVLAETFKIRSMLVHAFAGIALLLIGFYGTGYQRSTGEESIDAAPPTVNRHFEVTAASGAVFGFVYWLIAGRNAGRWRERYARVAPAAPAQPSAPPPRLPPPAA